MSNSAPIEGLPLNGLASSEKADVQHALALATLAHTRTAVVITDARRHDHPIILANKAFFDLTGYCAADVLGRNCRFLQGPKTEAAAISEIAAAVSAGREHTVELVNYRKDGSQFWNQLAISPVYDANGDLCYTIGSQQDVSERYRLEHLERAERRLLKEVDHRALNALALVEGIIRLTKADTVSRYAALAQGRIQALARAHGLLSASSWEAVPLADLTHAALEPVPAHRITFDGPPAPINAAKVQPLMTILHELAANALRHGALAHESGKIELSWRIEGATLILAWAETWNSASQASAGPPGFGFMITEAILRRQLKGTIQRDWNSAGLAVELRLAYP